MSDLIRRSLLPLCLCALGLAQTGCSIRMMAINTLGNALAGGSSGYAKDDDPELVRDAVPFALKTIEGLIDESPRHKGLLTAACSGFTQYSYAFIQQEADFVEAQDLDRATAMRVRAKKLYLRGRDYGIRAFEVEFPRFGDRLRTNTDGVLARLSKKHVPLLYYTAAAWAAAFALDIADSRLSVEQTLFEKMMRRALVLDEGYELGSLHDFFISWDAAHATTGSSIESAREHFERAKALARGQRASLFVSLAESVSVSEQNKKEFEQLLNEALAVDITLAPEQKLANVISQRRAKWLLSRIDELF
ncbi:MAG: TRAP transporter TatT component family protein [Acidobacteria bacterium]|nr:TRAP transporter TatT component family protein [Acidobacteriota bacterium]